MLSRHCLKACGEAAFTASTTHFFQGYTVAIKRTAGRLVSRNVGPLVAKGALCTQQHNVLWHSGCVLAGWVCVLRGVSSKLCRMLYSHFISCIMYCSRAAVALPVTVYVFVDLPLHQFEVSSLLILCLVVGSQMVEVYSSVGLT